MGTTSSSQSKEKNEYQDLASDLAQQMKGFRVLVVPIVVGDLGMIVRMRQLIPITLLYEL